MEWEQSSSCVRRIDQGAMGAAVTRDQRAVPYRSAQAVCAMLLSSGILTAVPWSAIPAAGSSAESSSTLKEGLVTATKRSESLQDVPLSITALSAQTLERAGIMTFEDYAAKVPNLTFATGLGIMDARQVSIRGIQGVNTTG